MPACCSTRWKPLAGDSPAPSLAARVGGTRWRSGAGSSRNHVGPGTSFPDTHPAVHPASSNAGSWQLRSLRTKFHPAARRGLREPWQYRVASQYLGASDPPSSAEGRIGKKCDATLVHIKFGDSPANGCDRIERAVTGGKLPKSPLPQAHLASQRSSSKLIFG